ncbi:Gfo/Idh/MocA family protein [Dyadobacter luticola]|uniref:Gfo/Idh/MocA family oxidoreductase n=1 Tax=Dyadobacter luticola TaxID=1979387 RepID=A0A5R9L4H0_9BACT|nr:Gfo/Idh/MocA family oxidoreductase [Dyadobacter luticola]TLV03318.1 Gfo/Idh/MocA family oxidoreductase [Dyadobacter luticola]
MQPTRRKFLQNVTAASALLATESIAKPFNIIRDLKKISPNDKIRFATIGMGIQGHSDTRAAIRSTPEAEFVAAADLYDGRLTRVKEQYGKDIFTTRDFRQILERKDIDVVLIVTPDHWHDHITKAALKAGKNVYCEKPMVHHIDEGLSVIDAWKKSGKTMQVGSQSISSAPYREAKKMMQAGDIGEINFVESSYDRFDSIGAWNYSIPTDASPQTLDWDTFLGDAPKVPFDAKRFFRWRNYRDYGTGVAGDLFVHLITGVHFVTSSLGPERIMSSGELSYWKDGRDVPDVLVSILDYPKTDIHTNFQMVLRVNFANAGAISNTTRIVGTEGQIQFTANSLVLNKKKLPKAPGMGGYDSFNTFSEAQQKEFKTQYDAQYPEDTRKAEPIKEVKFEAPKGDDAHANHFADFFENVKKGSLGNVEDPVFGFRAAAPVLACNESYFGKKIVNWDPVNMKKKK